MMEPYKFARNTYRRTIRAASHWKNTLTDRKPKLLILAYHRVRPQILFDPIYAAVTLKTFIKQLEALVKRYRVISLADAVRFCGNDREDGGTRAVLTFDDGYSDIYEFAFPELKKRGLPAAVFLPADYVDMPVPLWDSEVIAIAGQSKGRLSAIPLLGKMKGLKKEELRSAIDSLKSAYVPGTSDRCVRWDEARRMNEAGIEVGSHGASHRSLARIPFEEARDEIKRSKELIEHGIGSPCRHFAFPFGSRNDYNEKLIDYVREAGFMSSLTNIHGYNCLPADPFRLKRIIMEEATSINCLLG